MIPDSVLDNTDPETLERVLNDDEEYNNLAEQFDENGNFIGDVNELIDGDEDGADAGTDTGDAGDDDAAADKDGAGKAGDDAAGGPADPDRGQPAG
jgi:hypothetical protein